MTNRLADRLAVVDVTRTSDEDVIAEAVAELNRLQNEIENLEYALSVKLGRPTTYYGHR